MEDSVQEAFHKKEQVSRTLEYAFDDYALSVVANSLHKTSDAKQLQLRAANYKNVFDSTVGMVRGRYTSKQWVAPFQADARAAYITEGTPRQYSFYVPHDVAGLAKLMGGDKKLENTLDSLFVKNEYWHGNEPGHQVPFMYNYTASPWKTQKIVSAIREQEYSDGPGGLSGNDDAGQMSAWYIFAAIGFYPVNPVSGEHLLSTPLFDSVTIHLPGNKVFKIISHKKSSVSPYISRIYLNDALYNKNFIGYETIMKGGVMDIELQSTPSAWGSGVQNRPLR